MSGFVLSRVRLALDGMWGGKTLDSFTGVKLVLEFFFSMAGTLFLLKKMKSGSPISANIVKLFRSTRCSYNGNFLGEDLLGIYIVVLSWVEVFVSSTWDS